MIGTLFFVSQRGHSVEIMDVTKEQVITLRESNKPKNVIGLRLKITGYIDGSATIQRAYEDKKMYEPKMISGNVNLNLGGDWYNDKCLIIYKPSNVTSGTLKIKYKFGTL